MANTKKPVTARTGEAATYRNNPHVLRWIRARTKGGIQGSVNDSQFNAAIADPLTLQFARCVTGNPNGLPHPRFTR